jgi:hypothetical protein
MCAATDEERSHILGEELEITHATFKLCLLPAVLSIT